MKDENKTNKLIESLKNLQTDIFSLNTIEERKDKYNKICKLETIDSFILMNKIYCIRPGLYPIRDEEIFKKINFDTLLKAPIIDFLRNENITIINTDAIDILKEYQNNNKTLILLDPPYLVSCNSFYNDPKCNIYEYLYNNKINNMQSKILLILENIWIIKLLFNDFEKMTYNKKYQSNKKNTEHTIYANF